MSSVKLAGARTHDDVPSGRRDRDVVRGRCLDMSCANRPTATLATDSLKPPSPCSPPNATWRGLLGCVHLNYIVIGCLHRDRLPDCPLEILGSLRTRGLRVTKAMVDEPVNGVIGSERHAPCQRDETRTRSEER